MRNLATLGLIALLSVPLATCSDNSLGATGGTTRTLLTDGPFPYSRVARVDVYIVSVSASLSPDTAGGAGGFVTLATPQKRFNLLELSNGITEELGIASLSTGAITAVRVVINTDLSSITLKDGRVLTGETSNPPIHWQSSAGQPVLNALIHENIAVPDTGAIVVIDYDVGNAFIPSTDVEPIINDSGFVFSPTLRAADATRTGSVSGVVRAHDAGGAPVGDASLRLYLAKLSQAENTWPTMGHAKTDANGAFKFSYVTPSDHWTATGYAGWAYVVAIDPPPGAGLTRVITPSVVVNARVDATVGTVALP